MNPEALPVGTAVQYTDDDQTRLVYVREGGMAHYGGGPTVPWPPGARITAVFAWVPDGVTLDEAESALDRIPVKRNMAPQPLQPCEDSAMTLTEFLRARIDADEAEAGQWMRGYGEFEPLRDRVLVECLVKRAMIDQATLAWSDFDVKHRPNPPGPEWWLGDGSARREVSMAVLRLLAVPYAEHPDYDESWRPIP